MASSGGFGNVRKLFWLSHQHGRWYCWYLVGRHHGYTVHRTAPHDKECVVCCAKSLQSCSTLCDPMDCSLPGSSVHGILQARILEWVAAPFSRGIFLTQGSSPGLVRCRCCRHWCLSHQGSPKQ